MNREYRVIVAHPLGQHSAKLAAALKQAGMLHAYITTAYYKKGTLTKFLACFLKGDNKARLQAKKSNVLDDREVKVFRELLGILMLVVNRVDKKKAVKYKVDRWLADSFGRKVAKYAIKERVDAVVMYDLYAGAGFAYLKRKAPQIKRIMDASAAYVGSMRDTFSRECNKGDVICDDHRAAYSQFWNPKWCASVLNEVKETEYIIAASEYCRRSYWKADISKKNTFIVPYGVDISKFHPNEKAPDPVLKIIYVGSSIPGKGLQYLLYAIAQIKDQNIKVTVIGPIDSNSVLYERYGNIDYIDFAGKVNFSKIEKYYQESDVFILPSLSEGLTLSGLEAMACGVPVICTSNSGINDLIKEGENGFVVPTGDVRALQERITWCCENREHLEAMREAARQTAEEYSWERYNRKAIEVFHHILEDNTVGGRNE